jgi:2-polyprenyl-3-methyl-5-hydroxy-6-metoxy-1,4-benzoquinol methylase
MDANKMDLRLKLPEGRTYQQVKNHYLVEKSIADRLKAASREERKLIYSGMYDELFQKVPDHPRLTVRSSEQLTRSENKNKLKLIKKLLNPDTVFLEFAPGDCRFAFETAKYVRKVYGVDISDQIGEVDKLPENFNLIIYDGYQLDGIEANSIDLIFSDQFIEHLHPDDTFLHFELAFSLLKPGGKYIFRTPHAFSGPYDVSMYFSDIPQGFHLKEWTYSE